jgi:hypothetical protein
VTHRATTLAPVLASLVACGGGQHATSPASTPAEIHARLDAARGARHSYNGDTVMDYLFDAQRAKLSVKVMGETGAKLRLQAENPADGSTLADLACDGTRFVYLDYRRNCVRTGPCDHTAIATFLHVDLEPDDFLQLALGGVPTIAGASERVTRDGDHQRLELTSTAATQTIVVDDASDVVSAELRRPDATVAWTVDHKDVRLVDGMRVPARSRLQSPPDGDLIVEWKEEHVNQPLKPEAFTFAPTGLPTCP